jgi:DNA-binding NtrC family response regulator
VVTLVTQTLEYLGYRAIGFSDPSEALKAFSSQPQDFAAVVTDFFMAPMSGVALAREILRISPTTPVVLVSGYLGVNEKSQAERLGIKAVLTKPNFIGPLTQLLSRKASHVG